jgi:hypothetical protein
MQEVQKKFALTTERHFIKIQIAHAREVNHVNRKIVAIVCGAFEYTHQKNRSGYTINAVTIFKGISNHSAFVNEIQSILRVSKVKWN